MDILPLTFSPWAGHFMISPHHGHFVPTQFATWMVPQHTLPPVQIPIGESPLDVFPACKGQFAPFSFDTGHARLCTLICYVSPFTDVSQWIPHQNVKDKTDILHHAGYKLNFAIYRIVCLIVRYCTAVEL